MVGAFRLPEPEPEDPEELERDDERADCEPRAEERADERSEERSMSSSRGLREDEVVRAITPSSLAKNTDLAARSRKPRN
ncbi:hypothetical protein B9T39_06560 [Alloscardovia macacae]|uniref:Uncharacterized protein n=1 Tax=Alloscardovia macacae TaxID=1160091 RepID=A0A1Y2SX34_9BIFI|nr:hypothetical protein B9T39_06560 [Alloscardovia macacae]